MGGLSGTVTPCAGADEEDVGPETERIARQAALQM